MSRHLVREFLESCHDNNLNGVTDCLSRGVDVNTVSEDGYWSGLTIAAEKNYTELLEILLSRPDIKINNTTKKGYWGYLCTALMYACDTGNPATGVQTGPGVRVGYQLPG